MKEIYSYMFYSIMKATTYPQLTKYVNTHLLNTVINNSQINGFSQSNHISLYIILELGKILITLSCYQT